VVHAGDDPHRISGEVVGQRTEVDTLAVRLPYSRETSGFLLPIHDPLVNGAEGKFDVVFAEVKSGDSNSPNPSWQHQKKLSNIEYMLKFIGLHEDESTIKEVATQLQRKFTFEEASLRFRYIIFSKSKNKTWKDRGVNYITFDDCIRFISEDRGQCWLQARKGRRSLHGQWDELINNLRSG
jgi:hypothetical protein